MFSLSTARSIGQHQTDWDKRGHRIKEAKEKEGNQRRKRNIVVDIKPNKQGGIHNEKKDSDDDDEDYNVTTTTAIVVLCDQRQVLFNETEEQPQKQLVEQQQCLKRGHQQQPRRQRQLRPNLVPRAPARALLLAITR